jgi:hypothetical protein
VGGKHGVYQYAAAVGEGIQVDIPGDPPGFPGIPERRSLIRVINITEDDPVKAYLGGVPVTIVFGKDDTVIILFKDIKRAVGQGGGPGLVLQVRHGRVDGTE